MTKMPPVPSANRSPKGPGASPPAKRDTTNKDARPENLDQQDEEGNIKQNTTNRAHQQDR